MKGRDYYFDNAKFFLIFFVVFGHFIQSFINDNENIYTLYKVIYTFHMPAFILVSGFFAKGIAEKGYVRKYVKRLIVPYLIFQLVYSVFYYYLYGKSTIKIEPLSPHWSLWFLVSLFFWNIFLLYFAKLKPILGIMIALVLGLLIGCFEWTSSYLSLTRTFVFFPIFLIGFYMKKEHFQLVQSKFARVCSIIIFLSVFIGFHLYPFINYQWLFGSKSYEALGEGIIVGMGIRICFYLLSFIMIFCFFACVPKKEYFFTKFGKYTLYVYLLHGFIIRIFRESHLPEIFESPNYYIMIVIVSLLLTMFLSSNMIISLTQPIIELKGSKLKKWLDISQNKIKL
ncbi:acyltransferase family protein [Bacillus sp. B1-b2]|uniref:acyltransferase family protein n=1 Tax=Bacillus sp. B1-b2 TaxID=2653201 RepID=UPI001261F321|nr:acyltransferase family protein [Bacillus sp. B1-b2]KAB7669347.1 acyltransferase family protein [Bacillus sp. B1-b2]